MRLALVLTMFTVLILSSYALLLKPTQPPVKTVHLKIPPELVPIPPPLPPRHVRVPANGAASFDCATVKVAEWPLPDTTTKLVMEEIMGHKILAYDSITSPGQITPCYLHPLIGTLLRSYGDHRPLKLTPDMMWLLILQGVSVHVNENHEQLKKVLFKNQTPQTIVVRNDSLNFKKPDEWKKLTHDFTAAVEKYTKTNMRSFFSQEFSTTSALEKTVYDITLLEAVKKSFKYVGMSGCGIPHIRLGGTRADWQKIYDNLDELNALGLNFWVKEIKPIMQEFLNACDGKVDLKFWNSIFKEELYYGTHNLSGWIIKFFPYIKNYVEFKKAEPEMGITTLISKYVKNPYLEGETYLLSGLQTDDLPSGISTVEMVWEQHDLKTGKFMAKVPLTLRGGFVGIIQDAKTLELSTCINWAICDTVKMREFEYNLRDRAEYGNTTHPNEYWTIQVFDTVNVQPVFDSLRNKTATAGLADFNKRFIQALKKYPELKNVVKSGFVLKGVVTSMGTMAKIDLHGILNTVQKNLILKELLPLSRNWSPPYKMLQDLTMHGPQDRPKERYFKVNYPVTLKIKE
ncbi:MAG TPA: DUF4419 domain-containing protein [Flavobacteriales bacterium]|nr:DUF4419 domain-containing protein [Flavobacteriales bacterium]